MKYFRAGTKENYEKFETGQPGKLTEIRTGYALDTALQLS
jgi:hypothetical protein